MSRVSGMIGGIPGGEGTDRNKLQNSKQIPMIKIKMAKTVALGQRKRKIGRAEKNLCQSV
jgi:hypothetical protein